MTDDRAADMLRRAHAAAGAVADEGSPSWKASLAAVTEAIGSRPSLPYARPVGEDLAAWRRNVAATDIHRNGDATLVWMNEADLQRPEMREVGSENILPAGVDHERLKAAIERPHVRILDTRPHDVQPRMLDRIFGDGRRLLMLTSVTLAPQYWVARVDSGWRIHQPETGVNVADRIDEVMDALEEEFGVALDEDDEGNPLPDDSIEPWPAVPMDRGVSWAWMPAAEATALLAGRDPESKRQLMILARD